MQATRSGWSGRRVLQESLSGLAVSELLTVSGLRWLWDLAPLHNSLSRSQLTV